MASIIENKNQFVLDTSKRVMHALISQNGPLNKEPEGIAMLSREYAIALWRAMRHPIE